SIRTMIGFARTRLARGRTPVGILRSPDFPDYPCTMTRTGPESAIAAQPVSALSPLRFPVFRTVWAANVMSSFGGQIQSVAAAWLMTSIAPSADMVALVQSSVSLPIVVLALLAGAMADSYDRRKVMLAAQVFMLVVSVSLTVVAWTGWITPW